MFESDSESDDELLSYNPLNQNSLSASQRQQQECERKKKLEAENDAVLARNKDRLSQRVQLIQQGAYSDTITKNNDSLLLSQRVLAEVASSKSKNITKDELQRELDGLAGLYKDSFLPDNELKARILAMHSNRHEPFGKRLVVHYDPKQATATNANLSLFESTNEAIAALQKIVTKHLELEGSMEVTGLKRGAMSPLQRLDSVIGEGPGVLTLFLDTGRLAELVLATDAKGTMQAQGLEEVCSWLFCSALSFDPNHPLAVGSKNGLMAFLSRGLVPEPCWFRSLSSLRDCLKAWTYVDVDVDSMQCNDKENSSQKAVAADNLTGLEHLLSLWNDSLAHGVALEVDPSIATAVVVALLHLSLDELTLGARDSIQNILATVTERVEAAASPTFEKWTAATAAAVLHDISSVGQVPDVDFNDSHGYLSCSLILEVTPVTTGRLKVALLSEAFEYVLQVKDWREHVFTALAAFDKRDKVMDRANGSTWWFCLISSVVAFDVLRDESSSHILEDLSRVHAISLLALAAFDLAMLQWPPSDAPVREYGRKTEAALIHDVLRHLELAVEEAKLISKQSLQDTNCRSTHFLCTSFENYLTEAAALAAVQGDLVVRDKVQTTCDSYFKSSSY